MGSDGTRLTPSDVQGIWAGVTICWDESDRFDTECYRANARRMCSTGCHGIYTSGSTGEFYALRFDEFKQMVDVQAEVCGAAGVPLQIGCCADVTWKTIRMLEYAASKPEVGAAQVVLPYWMRLNDREVLQFFADLHRACPALPLIHYNIDRTKRYLTGDDYVRILEVAPNLIGVKFVHAGAHFGELQQALRLTPQLSYFVAEKSLASAMMLGARGSYSSLICTEPNYMLRMYEHCKQGRWPLAIQMQSELSQFLGDCERYIETLGEGTSDPVFDKGLAVATGCMHGSQRTRAPYLGWTDETVLKLRGWLKLYWPQFLYHEKNINRPKMLAATRPDGNRHRAPSS